MRLTLTHALVGAQSISVATLLVLGSATSPAQSQEASVLTYHWKPDRSGNFTAPALTWANARSVHLDQEFRAQVSGHIYAQPLYWEQPGSQGGTIIVATESDEVFALDSITGQQRWKRSLGNPIARDDLPCGDIDPLGITGTPVIDASKQVLYLSAFVEQPNGPSHLVFGLSLSDGSLRSGWPVDVTDALRANNQRFDPRTQNQRGALTILDGMVYVPFGGHFGDCGDYHGWIVGFPLDKPQSVRAWSTRARGGGIWAPGGISSDGRSLFFATGNTFGADTWSDGEAVFRLAPDLRRTDHKQDFFASSNWRTLDNRDADLGGTNPLPIDVTTNGTTQSLVLALGKDGHAYLLDRANLGGIGGQLAERTVSEEPIRTAPATFPTTDGAFVAFQGEGTDCLSPRGRGDLTVLHIRAGSPPTIATAWCGAVGGRGSPIVTTTDGHTDPIVWMLGAEGDNRLHAFQGDTGEPLFTSGALTGLRRFQTLIVARNRIYIAADRRVYAFAL
jgi:outer membrane protein assembly factor BamB